MKYLTLLGLEGVFLWCMFMGLWGTLSFGSMLLWEIRGYDELLIYEYKVI